MLRSDACCFPNNNNNNEIDVKNVHFDRCECAWNGQRQAESDSRWMHSKMHVLVQNFTQILATLVCCSVNRINGREKKERNHSHRSRYG